jgi:hypothetical protein
VGEVESDVAMAMFIGLEHVWNDDTQCQTVIDTFIRIGTNIILHEGESWKRISLLLQAIWSCMMGALTLHYSRPKQSLGTSMVITVPLSSSLQKEQSAIV